MPLLETEAPGWPRTIAFLAARAITGIEVVTAQSYKRAVVLNGISRILKVSPDDLAWRGRWRRMARMPTRSRTGSAVCSLGPDGGCRTSASVIGSRSGSPGCA